jgi:hypothetical protein
MNNCSVESFAKNFCSFRGSHPYDSGETDKYAEKTLSIISHFEGNNSSINDDEKKTSYLSEDDVERALNGADY